MSKAEMILYSPASYFLCIIEVQIIEEPIFLWDICDSVMFIFAMYYCHFPPFFIRKR